METNNYTKGLHILAELSSVNIPLLTDAHPFVDYIDQHIAKNGLTRLGEVKYNFNGGGFTAVICLTESHLSVHTWPEFEMLTTDIYLSNHTKDNQQACRNLYDAIKQYFGAGVINMQEIWR